MEKVGWGVGEERNVLFLREWTSGVPCYWELGEELRKDVAVPCAHSRPPLLGLSLGRVTAEKFRVLLLAAQPAPMVTENSLRQRRQQTRQERMRPIPIFFSVLSPYH